MVRSGIQYSFGYGFWGANGHDGIWHLALSESLAKGSLENPVFAGEALKNYHLGFDLLVALVNVVTNIPISYIYFQILPPLFAILIGLLTYIFVLNWRGSRTEAKWATFFVYFSSSFGFIVTFLRDRQITGESMFWSQQAISTLVNPPFALSLILILLGLISLQKKNLILSILFFGLLIQIKVYAGLLVLGGLFCASLFELISKRYSLVPKVFLGALIFSLAIFLPFNKNPQSMIVWQPMWFLETMMSYSDRLGWQRFYSAMTTYKMGGIWFKEFLAYGVAFVIFIIGNMGSRVIGLYYFYSLTKKKIKFDSIQILIISIVTFAVVIPTFFVQSGTPWNTIQFFYYYLFFFSIFAGMVTSQSNNFVKFFVVVFAIFGSWATLQHYLPKMPQAIISNDEIEALNFLAKEPEGTILTYPFDKYKATGAIANPPRHLHLYDSTAYVAAYTRKVTFLDDEVNLNIMGYDWQTRREEVLWFVSNLDIEKAKSFLKTNNIKYLYLVKAVSPLQGELLKLGSTELDLEKIFENKESIIYRYGENLGSN